MGRAGLSVKDENKILLCSCQGRRKEGNIMATSNFCRQCGTKLSTETERKKGLCQKCLEDSALKSILIDATTYDTIKKIKEAEKYSSAKAVVKAAIAALQAAKAAKADSKADSKAAKK